jgi:hypothetical protein
VELAKTEAARHQRRIIRPHGIKSSQNLQMNSMALHPMFRDDPCAQPSGRSPAYGGQMSRLFSLSAIVIAGLVFTPACSSRSDSPTAPASASAVGTGSPGAAASGSGQGASPTHGEELVALTGAGSGIVNVTATAAVPGTFSAQINVNVHGAAPNTTFYVQRAPEVGRANGADGICQRAAGVAPWGPPAPNFVTFPMPAAGPLVTLQTSNGGAGAVHIDFSAPTISDGTQFDVMFRLVDSLTSPTTELRTGCFTVTAK